MITWTDYFAGGGGSSTGIFAVPGTHVVMAANHNKLVTEIHAANHQQTDHAVVDLHQERPSFFVRTRCAWFSPECTKWSQANGSQGPAIEEGLFEDPLSDDVKLRSRLLMFDVLRYIEYHRYDVVIVENVVDIATQSKYRTAWTIWRQELRALGYAFRVVSLNSMHAQTFGAPAPQSWDRIYIVAWPEGGKAPDLDRVLRPRAYCTKCDMSVESVQSFKHGREVGRYRQAYLYCCSRCGAGVEPGWLPAAAAIDWTIPGERIGDRLKSKTRLRIAAGIARYWGPFHLEASGNQYDAADPKHLRFSEPNGYYRAWPMSEPLRTLNTHETKALAVPVEGRDGKVASPVDVPMRAQTTRAETALAHMPFIAEMYGTSTARPVTEPAGTFTAGGNHHGLVMHYERDRLTPSDPHRETLATTTGGGIHDALIHRHNGGGAEMTTLAAEYLRTLTTGGNVSLLQHPEKRRLTDADMRAAEEMVPEVLFRMFRPSEVAAGMAFPPDYVWQPVDRLKPVSNRDLVKAAGNAVTPPAARDLVGAIVQSLEVAS